MNWRLGFKRIAIMLAVLYWLVAIFACISTYNSQRNEYVLPTAYYLNKGGRNYRVWSYSQVEAQAALDATPPVTGADIMLQLDNPQAAPAELGDQFSGRFVDHPERGWQALGMAIAVSIGCYLGLVLVYRTARWIVLGFVEPTPRG